MSWPCHLWTVLARGSRASKNETVLNQGLNVHLEKREVQTIAEEKIKRDRGEKVKGRTLYHLGGINRFIGGHEVYVPPLRRGSSAEVNPLDKIVTEEISKPEKPIKSILKKPKEKSTDEKPTEKSTRSDKTDKKSDKDNSGTDDESYKRKQREQKEVNNFVQSKSYY